MQTTLSATVDAYINSVNTQDRSAFLALFTDNAKVEDAGRSFQGRDAVRDWSHHDIFEPNVTVEVSEAVDQGDHQIVRTKVDGDFDRTGLPNPLFIDHRFEIVGGRIAHLACRLAGTDPL